MMTLKDLLNHIQLHPEHAQSAMRDYALGGYQDSALVSALMNKPIDFVLKVLLDASELPNDNATYLQSLIEKKAIGATFEHIARGNSFTYEGQMTGSPVGRLLGTDRLYLFFKDDKIKNVF